MGRRAVAAVTLLLVATSGYAAADVLDVAPGILTRDRPGAAPATGSAAVSASLPLPSAAASSATPAAARVPTRAGLARTLRPVLRVPALGPSVGVSIRDGITGQELYAVSAGHPRTAASTQKLLSALAITSSVDGSATMTTRTVRGRAPGDVILVAGGDTLLGTGAGSPARVAGRAGIGALAARTAAALDAAGVRKVRLRLDLTYAAGPRYPRGWNLLDVAAGYTQGVSMIGFAAQRPHAGRPSPREPERVVADRFAAELARRGHPTTIRPASTWRAPAPHGATELGRVESATYSEVLALALDTSDNALTENLTRQAMARQGESPAAQGAPAAFVADRLRAAGIPTTGMRLVDTSGLARGQQVSAETISAVLGAAVRGTPPGLRTAVTELPVAGLTGTLTERFLGPRTRAVAGIPRAKTGTLDGVGSLAGVTTDRDGRPLTFVILADDVPTGWAGREAARSALDRVVATLTGCGCR